MSELNTPAGAREFLTASRRDAVLVRRALLPVAFEAPGGSYIGGLPKLPRDLEWPSIDIDGEKRGLTFIAQIDLSELPDFESRSLLPKEGTLFFFGEMWSAHERGEAGRVLYAPDAVAGAAPRPKPEKMLTMCPEDMGRPGGWLTSEEFGRQVDFRYPVSMHRFTSYRSGPSDTDFTAALHDASTQLHRESLERALGNPTVHLHNRRAQDECADWSDWPKSWLHVRHASRALMKVASDKTDAWRQASAANPGRAGKFERYESLYEKCAQTLLSLQDLSNARADWLALNPAEMAMVVGRIAEIKTSADELLRPYGVSKLLWHAVDFASKHCIAHGHPELVPERYVAFTREHQGWRALRFSDDADAQTYAACPMHQMFGWSRNRQNEDEYHGDEVLLFQLDAEPFLNLYPQEAGSFYFFIPRALLQRQKFSSVQFFGSS